MKTHRTRRRTIPVYPLSVMLLVAVVHSLSLQVRIAHSSELAPDVLHVGAATDKFGDTTSIAAGFDLPSPKLLRAQRTVLGIGWLSAPDKDRPFVSLGLVWRFPVTPERYFVEAGVSPTLLSGSYIDGRDLGGNLHFTSSASIGYRFGVSRRYSIALRIQHTSNGGLNRTNPGLDMIGLSFRFSPDGSSGSYRRRP